MIRDADLALLAEPRMQSAIAEMQDLIRERYPDAVFAVDLGDEPLGVYMTATVDSDDRHDVMDLYIDRLVDLQIDEGLRLHVIPVRPPERNAALLAAKAASGAVGSR